MKIRKKWPLMAVVMLLVAVLPSRAAEWVETKVPSTDAADDTAAGEGPLWLRCFVRVPENMTSRAEPDLWSDSVTLSLAGINAPFEVYLNGRKIGQGKSIPDEPRRRFKVPKGILEPAVFNVLALKLEGKEAAAGMRQAPILAGYFDELIFEGPWEMLRGEADEEALKPVAEQPAVAAYTEAGFKRSSTPLSANIELMPGRRLEPGESLAKMTTADDLAVDLMLAEPTVAQPTHLSFDERGRLWVAQYRQYPYPAGLKMISRDMYYRARFDKIPPPPPNHDRGRDVISVHEDTNGDGYFDQNKVVLEGLNMANAALRGHGGIWVMQTPYLLFYPDADGDDVPDADPQVRLAGFGLEDTHSVSNGLAWGPDGWLYGTQGSTTTCRVTRPDVDPPDAPAIYFEGCMTWRYHPKTRAFEIFSEGGGNNFGLEFDAEGRLFTGHNGGGTRGWHFVQHGLYMMQGVEPGKYGPPRNPFAFGNLPMMATANPVSRFTHNVAIFEGTGLPERYVGQIIGVDPLHRNLVGATRTPAGATFQTADTIVLLAGEDIAFRPVYLTAGPDGAIYIADFYEEFIAHGQNYQGQIDPSTGRVYRLRGKDMKLNKDVNLAKKSSAELVGTLSHPNRWHRQTAVRLIGERGDEAAVEPLKALLANPEPHPALEALWALHQLGALDETLARQAIAHPAAPVRAWAVRLMGDAKQLPESLHAAVLDLAKSETHPEVRAQIASTTRRLPVGQALALVKSLLQRDADAADPFIPMLCWWTIESHCDENRDAVLAILDGPGMWDHAPVRQHILPRLMRRLATTGTRADFLACARLLKQAPSDEHRAVLIGGFEEAFKGRALPPLPRQLVAALADSGHASPVLRVRLGEPEAIAQAVKRVADRAGTDEELLTTTTLLGEVHVPEAVQPLIALASSDQRPALRKAALTALLLYEEKKIGAEVAAFYSDLPPDIRPAAQNLLAARPAWIVSLLALIESGAITVGELPVEVVERLRAQEDPAIAELTQKLFPAPPPPANEAKRAKAERVRAVIEEGAGDPYKGEAIFMQRCAACHTLFFKGGRVGPNLTDYQRDDLGTMLSSIIDPNAEVREGFQSFIIRTKDGRTLSGFMVESDAAVVVLRGTDGQDVRLPREQIDRQKATGTSLMPEGLLEGLDDQQIRDFFAYLRIPQPITR